MNIGVRWRGGRVMAKADKILNDEGEEKMSLSDVMRMIGKNTHLYFCPETKAVNTIVYFYRKKEESGEIDFNEKIGEGYLGTLVCLPSYEEIDQKSIMTFYVKECVEDKKSRQKLFYILRNHDYMDKFLDAIKELNLYDEYIMVTDDIYKQIAEEWVEENCASAFSK
jgi:hypothetical protein